MGIKQGLETPTQAFPKLMEVLGAAFSAVIYGDNLAGSNDL